jgi:hypothetical protein
MNVRFSVLLAAAVLLAGCSGHPPLPGGHRSPESRPASATPVSCRVQYRTWRDGAASGPVGRTAAALAAVHAALRSGDISAIRAAARELMPAAIALAASPMPRCADPAGIYADFVDRIYAAGDNAHSATGLSALRRAAAPLKGLKEVDHQLAMELDRAVGKGVPEL